MRKLIFLGRDTAGSTVVEMAFLAPILATALIVMSDMAIGFSERLKLEQAAQSAIEKVMQGQATATPDSAAALKAEAAVLANVPASQVTVTFTLECVNGTTGAATVVTPYTSVCTPTQVTRRYMKVVIDKTYVPVFRHPYSGTTGGNFALRGTTSVRVQ